MKLNPFMVAAAVTLSACVHRFDPPPGVSTVQMMQDAAKCRYLARHGGASFAAVGDPNFVAGAAVGSAIGNGIRAANDYNDCMEMQGYTPKVQQ